MNNLIDIETLVKKAAKKGIDLGKGDPYNRLRYYTKIGWLPHMERLEGKGHYPAWAIGRLELIDQLKAQNLGNDEITKELNKKDRYRLIKNILFSKDLKTKVLSYSTFVILLLIFMNETEVITLGTSKSQLFEQYTNKPIVVVTDSGVSFVPKNANRVFIKTNTLNEMSKIQVTFSENFSPANRYWVTKDDIMQGFFVELDTAVNNNAEFSWWIIN